MTRITPRTCLWPLASSLCCCFALSIGLTFRSNHHCHAGTCGEWLFPLQARLHVVVWYCWLSVSITFLAVRAFHPEMRKWLRQPLLIKKLPLIGKHLAISGVLMFAWIISLYSIVVGIWWARLSSYFEERGHHGGVGRGNNILAAIALTGHICDITMGMALIPISRHSALASFFKISISTTLTFHMLAAYTLFILVSIHGLLYVSWVFTFQNLSTALRRVYPVLNPTYIYHETWPGNASSLGIWRASLIFTGSGTGLIMVAIFITTLPFIRNKHFNIFYFTHLLAIVAVVLVCLHASTMLYCTSPGLAMWLLDWSMRIYELRTPLSGSITSLGKGWYSLSIPLSRRRLKGCASMSSLAHFYIHHSESSIRELHPFTTTTHLASQNAVTASSREDITIGFLFRKRGTVATSEALSDLKPTGGVFTKIHRMFQRRNKQTQWTDRVAALTERSIESNLPSIQSSDISTAAVATKTDGWNASIPISLRLEGPYFTTADPTRFRTVVCLVAGTGVSGALAVAAAFKHIEQQALSLPPLADAVPSHPHQHTYSTSCDDGCNGEDSCRNSISMNINTQKRTWERCIIVWSVREADFVNLPGFAIPLGSGLEIRPHFTGNGRERCDVGSVLDDVLASDNVVANGMSGGKGEIGTWVYISGPNAFIAAGEEACKARQERGVEWYGARWDI